MLVSGFSDDQLSSIPAEIGNLMFLRTLDLSHNNLSSIPEEIGNINWFSTLDLSYNELRSIPAEIGNLTGVSALFLSDNQLSSIPAEIGKLTSLTILDLSGNWLSSIPAEIGKLTSLTTLDLRDNRLSSPIQKNLAKLPNTHITLGCSKKMSISDLQFFCTSSVDILVDEDCGRFSCLPASPKTVAAILWGAWLVVAVFIGISVVLVSWQCRPAQGAVPADVNGITAFGICKYVWGLLSLVFMLLDVITNFVTLGALVGSWTLYVVAFLIVLQHLVSGLMLYTQSVRKNSWPLLCPTVTQWEWDWQRCIRNSEGSMLIDSDVGNLSMLENAVLWPLGLAYVVVLDVLSILSLKLGLQFGVDGNWVNLQPYWASRELMDALLQALPQALFQTVIVVAHADPKVSKIAITTSQFVLSVSSSLASVVTVMACVTWEALMGRENVKERFWHTFISVLPVTRSI